MTSFPYLKIARDFGHPYGEVIRLVQGIEDIIAIDPGYFDMPRGSRLLTACIFAVSAERARRRGEP